MENTRIEKYKYRIEELKVKADKYQEKVNNLYKEIESLEDKVKTIENKENLKNLEEMNVILSQNGVTMAQLKEALKEKGLLELIR